MCGDNSQDVDVGSGFVLFILVSLILLVVGGAISEFLWPRLDVRGLAGQSSQSTLNRRSRFENNCRQEGNRNQYVSVGMSRTSQHRAILLGLQFRNVEAVKRDVAVARSLTAGRFYQEANGSVS